VNRKKDTEWGHSNNMVHFLGTFFNDIYRAIYRFGQAKLGNGSLL